MKIHILESEDGWREAAKNGLTPENVTKTVERGLAEVANLLPDLSQSINVVVSFQKWKTSPEYGVGGHTYTTEYIEVTLNESVPHGADATLESIRQTIYHEGNHAARWNMVPYDERFIASVPFEGLATVFEREYAHYQPPYGQYEDDATMQQWFRELQAGDWKDYNTLFFRHDDDRRWVGYKTGAWLIDTAVKNSGKTVVELTALPADEIFKLAGM